VARKAVNATEDVPGADASSGVITADTFTEVACDAPPSASAVEDA